MRCFEESSLVVVLLGEVVVRGAFLAGHEAGEAELGAGLLARGDPLAEAGLLELLLGFGVHLLGDDLSALVHHEVGLAKAAFGLVGGAVEHTAHGADDRFGLAGLLGDGAAAGDTLGGTAGGSARGAAAFRCLGGGGTASDAAAGSAALGCTRGHGLAGGEAGSAALGCTGRDRSAAGRTAATGDTGCGATDSHVVEVKVTRR